MTPALALLGLAVLLAWPVPRAMARRTGLRRSPRAALVVWQAVTAAAVLSALAAVPAAVLGLAGEGGSPGAHPVVLGAAVVVGGGVLGRLLLSGHRVGTRLRGMRRRHRELVDLVGRPVPGPEGRQVRVLAHPTPTAYCLPGAGSRVVLSRGTLDALPPDQLAAVLAHERSHLRARHDLVIEFFTVAHEAVPDFVRCRAALAEVRLLVEALADRAAVRAVGAVPTARALLALATAAAPEASLGGGGSAAAARLALLGHPEGGRARAAAMYVSAVLVVAAPIALLVLAVA